MTEVIYPLSHWQSAVALIPPEVVLACADNGECQDTPHGIYCLADGGVAIGPRRTFGKPSINPAFSSYSELIQIAARRGYSHLREDQVREACRFPNESGYLAFCATSTRPVVLSSKARAELAEAVISELKERWADEADLFQGADAPSNVLDRAEFPLIRAADIAQEVIDACRASLVRDILSDLQYLLDAAADWCEEQRLQSCEDIE